MVDGLLPRRGAPRRRVVRYARRNQTSSRCFGAGKKDGAAFATTLRTRPSRALGFQQRRQQFLYRLVRETVGGGIQMRLRESGSCSRDEHRRPRFDAAGNSSARAIATAVRATSCASAIYLRDGVWTASGTLYAAGWITATPTPQSDGISRRPLLVIPAASGSSTAAAHLGGVSSARGSTWSSCASAGRTTPTRSRGRSLPQGADDAFRPFAA
jgi:hypothetical protein